MPPEHSATRESQERDRSSERGSEAAHQELSRSLWDEMRSSASVRQRAQSAGGASAEGINRQALASAADGIFNGGAEDVNHLLQGRTQTERQSMNTLFRQQHGITIEQHLRRTLDGAELDRALNLLNRRDGQADDAGRIHTALIERSQWIEGRSDTVCEQDIRDTVSTLNSRQIQALDAEYRRRYGTGLREALVTSDALSEPTRQSISIYLRGTDQRTDVDTLRLADIA